MKIWFDISNSPHINLFHPLIKEICNDHTIIITCRPLANTIELLQLFGYKFHVIGKHYGDSILKKIWGYPIRVFQLVLFLKSLKPDIAISQSSFHSPLVSKILRIPSIYMNDNEHAIGNMPSFIFASKILVPEFIKEKKIYRQGARKSKIVKYPGVKEGIYLWNSSYIKIRKALLDSNKSQKKVYIRPEPWLAQYYSGEINFLDPVIIELKSTLNVVILPRDQEQADHYSQEKFSGIEVFTKPKQLTDILEDCNLFIGAGGTMTRELAVLGVPTISVYRDELLDVDRYLIKEGMMIHNPGLTANDVTEFIQSHRDQPPNVILLEKGKQSYELIKQLLIKNGKISND